MFYSSAHKVIQMKQKQDGSTLERDTKIHAHLLIMQPPQLNIPLSQMSNKVLLLASLQSDVALHRSSSIHAVRCGTAPQFFGPCSQTWHCTAVLWSMQSDVAMHRCTC